MQVNHRLNYSLTDGHLVCFQLLAVRKQAAMNICVPVPAWKEVIFWDKCNGWVIRWVWKGTAKLFSTVAIPFFCPRHQCMSEWLSPFLHSLTSIWWALLIIIQESVSCPLLPQSRLETSFNSLLNSSIIATFLEVLLAPWDIFFLLYFSLHLDLVKHLIKKKFYSGNRTC